MRIFISNTAADQTSQLEEANNFDLNDDNAPSWTLRVEGRLLDVRRTFLSKGATDRCTEPYFNSL